MKHIFRFFLFTFFFSLISLCCLNAMDEPPMDEESEEMAEPMEESLDMGMEPLESPAMEEPLPTATPSAGPPPIEGPPISSAPPAMKEPAPTESKPSEAQLPVTQINLSETEDLQVAGDSKTRKQWYEEADRYDKKIQVLVQEIDEKVSKLHDAHQVLDEQLDTFQGTISPLLGKLQYIGTQVRSYADKKQTAPLSGENK